METMVPHAFRMYDKPTLGRLQLLVTIIASYHRGFKDGEVVDLWRLGNVQSVCPSVISKQYKSPVIKSALPKFAEVDRYFDLITLLTDNVARHDLVPGQDR